MITSLAEYRRWTRDAATIDDDVLDALTEAQQLVETYCDRHFEQATRTETLLLHANGYVYPTAIPIAPGTTNPGYADGNGIAMGYGYGVTWPVNVNWLTPWPIPRVAVTYVGGYLPVDMPVAIKRIVARVANAALTSSPIPVGISGITSISIGDLSISGKDTLTGFMDLDDATVAALKAWKRYEIQPTNQANPGAVSWPFQ